MSGALLAACRLHTHIHIYYIYTTAAHSVPHNRNRAADSVENICVYAGFDIDFPLLVKGVSLEERVCVRTPSTAYVRTCVSACLHVRMSAFKGGVDACSIDLRKI